MGATPATLGDKRRRWPPGKGRLPLATQAPQHFRWRTSRRRSGRGAAAFSGPEGAGQPVVARSWHYLPVASHVARQNLQDVPTRVRLGGGHWGR